MAAVLSRNASAITPFRNNAPEIRGDDPLSAHSISSFPSIPIKGNIHQHLLPQPSAMDEKRRLPLHRAAPADMTTVVRRRRTRLWIPVLLIVLLGYSLLSSCNVDVRGRLDRLSKEATSAAAKAVGSRRKVPLEVHIMSKCPDAKAALQELILPAMQQVHDKVDFRLSFIAHLTPEDGVWCKHGPPECLGNIIELCARELYPDPKTSLGFVMCLTKDYEHIPERSLVEDCALEHAIDMKKLNECATLDDGAHGIDLLRTSVQHSDDVCFPFPKPPPSPTLPSV